MSLALHCASAMAFAPGFLPPQVAPALGAVRAQTPAMLLEAISPASLLADAAVLMPPAADGAAAAGAVAADAAQEPGFFDLCACSPHTCRHPRRRRVPGHCCSPQCVIFSAAL